MGSGKKRKPDLLPLGKGLTAAFEATLNQTYPIQAEEEQSEGGGGGVTKKPMKRTRKTTRVRMTTITRTLAQFMTSG